jgi:predicted protein tyrosine phosphatase
VLFVCSGNLDRSPTAEQLFGGWSDRWETDSAGTLPLAGGKGLTQGLVNWADLVLVMEPHHADYIYEHFKCTPDKVRILGISDKYIRDDPALIHELQVKVPPILELEDRLHDTEDFIASRRVRNVSAGA